MFWAVCRVDAAIGNAANTRSDSSPPIAAPACRPSSRPRPQTVIDADMVEQHRLGAHHVAHSDDRKIQTPRRSGRRIGRSRTGAAHAPANHVRADNKIPPGIDRTPGPTIVSHQPGLPVTGWSFTAC